MQRNLEIDDGKGEVYTVEREGHQFRSVFPAALAEDSRLHDSIEEAWLWVHHVRARHAALDSRQERDFEITFDMAARRTYHVRATRFEEAVRMMLAGEATLAGEVLSDFSDVQVTDRDAGQWIFRPFPKAAPK